MTSTILMSPRGSFLPSLTLTLTLTLTLSIVLLALGPRGQHAFTPVSPTHLVTTTTKTKTKTLSTCLQLDVSGRDVDIDSVMDETEAALRAAEESLASPPPVSEESPKKQELDLDLDIDGLLGDAEDALQAADEALQQNKNKPKQPDKQPTKSKIKTKTKPMNYMSKKRLYQPPPDDQEQPLTVERLEELKQQARAQALLRFTSSTRSGVDPMNPMNMNPDTLTTDQLLLQDPPPVPVEAQVTTASSSSSSRTPEENQEILASTLGGIVTGIVVGVAAFQVIPDLDMMTEPSIPPILASVVLGVVYYTTASDVAEGSNGAVVRSLVGKPMQAIGNGILGVIASIGNAMTSAAQRQVTKTTDNIKAIPGRAANEIKASSGRAADNIKAIPGRAANEIKASSGRAADNIKAIPGRAADAASRQATKVVQDIQATPGRVVDSVKQKVGFNNQQQQQRQDEEEE